VAKGPDFSMNAEGWSAGAMAYRSPNCDARPQGGPIDLLVIHNISLPPRQFGGDYIRDLFLNQLDCDAHPYFDQLRNLHVSAHFFIRRHGQVEQYVATEQRAWHAGVSTFLTRERCNDFSIGIELEGSDFEPFTDEQYTALVQLTEALCQHHGLRYVAGHEDIAPVRKTDPGPYFDWQRYQQAVKGKRLALWFPFQTDHIKS
jgi:AmpD protein